MTWAWPIRALLLLHLVIGWRMVRGPKQEAGRYHSILLAMLGEKPTFFPQDMHCLQPLCHYVEPHYGTIWEKREPRGGGLGHHLGPWDTLITGTSLFLTFSVP